ncbi:hypothetical protein TBLA_0F03440 [Henningerozyma blattae CBS 6284]|uniref:Cullin family profile domain-containing protein n=1 Tax=Henningerozyma blattae (strain ATCC 34711 / CBS 6284 / DSM 70876 / NBRC 10599 / NRRL Y-10934 / UCD 77-7) TaxID=1071380 RepID=I2H679_HENB6|nr:hypothetical protein TBLA_0F03440 [Tetrapisispora blattae CBS 6284]CCH61881.1 hypothetical protein TBLA_0F03440 [Tetrapisispora blattae CBS 6284]
MNNPHSEILQVLIQKVFEDPLNRQQRLIQIHAISQHTSLSSVKQFLTDLLCDKYQAQYDKYPHSCSFISLVDYHLNNYDLVCNISRGRFSTEQSFEQLKYLPLQSIIKDNKSSLFDEYLQICHHYYTLQEPAENIRYWNTIGKITHYLQEFFNSSEPPHVFFNIKNCIETSLQNWFDNGNSKSFASVLVNWKKLKNIFKLWSLEYEIDSALLLHNLPLIIVSLHQYNLTPNDMTNLLSFFYQLSPTTIQLFIENIVPTLIKPYSPSSFSPFISQLTNFNNHSQDPLYSQFITYLNQYHKDLISTSTSSLSMKFYKDFWNYLIETNSSSSVIQSILVNHTPGPLNFLNKYLKQKLFKWVIFDLQNQISNKNEQTISSLATLDQFFKMTTTNNSQINESLSHLHNLLTTIYPPTISTHFNFQFNQVILSKDEMFWFGNAQPLSSLTTTTTTLWPTDSMQALWLNLQETYTKESKILQLSSNYNIVETTTPITLVYKDLQGQLHKTENIVIISNLSIASILLLFNTTDSISLSQLKLKLQIDSKEKFDCLKNGLITLQRSKLLKFDTNGLYSIQLLLYTKKFPTKKYVIA